MRFYDSWIVYRSYGLVSNRARPGTNPLSLFNPRTYTQIHTPTAVQGGGGGGGRWMEPLRGVFDLMQYFETILPLVESH